MDYGLKFAALLVNYLFLLVFGLYFQFSPNAMMTITLYSALITLIHFLVFSGKDNK